MATDLGEEPPSYHSSLNLALIVLHLLLALLVWPGSAGGIFIASGDYSHELVAQSILEPATASQTIGSPVIAESRQEIQQRESQRKESESIRLAQRTVIPREVVPVERSHIQDYAFLLIVETWGEGEWSAFNTLVMKESGWNQSAVNKSSGACGLMQALPCKKMGLGENWASDYQGQLKWGVQYIKGRYGAPSAALSFHRAKGWY